MKIERPEKEYAEFDDLVPGEAFVDIPTGELMMALPETEIVLPHRNRGKVQTAKINSIRLETADLLFTEGQVERVEAKVVRR